MRGHLPALHIGRMDLGSARYTIRINGHLGATLLSAFPALALRRDGAHTVLTGLLDQSALFGVLAEIEALGLELIEVRQHPPERELPAWLPTSATVGIQNIAHLLDGGYPSICPGTLIYPRVADYLSRGGRRRGRE
jgi:hypothetical protein